MLLMFPKWRMISQKKSKSEEMTSMDATIKRYDDVETRQGPHNGIRDHK